MDFFDLHCDTITTAMHQSVGLDCNYLDISFPKNEEIKRHCQCFAVFCPDVISGEDAFNYYTMSKHFFEKQLIEFSQLYIKLSVTTFSRPPLMPIALGQLVNILLSI